MTAKVTCAEASLENMIHNTIHIVHHTSDMVFQDITVKQTQSDTWAPNI